MKPVTFSEANSRYEARFAYDQATIAYLKERGLRFDGQRRVWWTPSQDVAQDVERISAMTAEERTALQEAMQRERALQVVASRATDAELVIPAPRGLDYLPFQRAGIAYAASRPSVLIGDEMGLGKTIQAIGIVNLDPLARSVLIICPASLKLNWQREFAKWDVKGLSVGIGSGSSLPDTDVVIVNYEIVAKNRDAIDSRTWHVLVVDECHYLKNPKAQRTIAVLGKKKSSGIQAARRIFLSGTPIVNRPIEFWPMVESLDPNGLGASFWKYVSRYCNARQNNFGWDFSGSSNPEELQQRARATFMVRRKKEAVLQELPPKRRQVVEIPANGLSDLLRAEASLEMLHSNITEAARVAVELAKASDDDDAYARAVRALRDATQVAFEEMADARHRLALAKVPAIVEFVRDAAESSGKVVVFCWHRDVVAALMDALGPTAVQVHGGVSITARQEAVDAFQTNPEIRVFVGTIKAAGTGLTLTAASHVVFGELWWVPGDISQAEDRCHRIGQHDSVLVQHLVVDGSLDSRMAKILVEKQAVLDAAMDTPTDLVPSPEESDLTPPPEYDEAAAAASHPFSRNEISALADKITSEQSSGIHDCLRLLARLNPDHAAQRNEMGFNRVDTRIGMELASLPSLSPKQAALGLTIIRKYHRQLPEALLLQATGDAH